MRNLARFALSTGAAALFAGCGASQPPVGAAALSRLSGSGLAQQQPSYRRNAAIIYSFGSKTPDGVYPSQTLTDVHGTFYGETYENIGYSRSGNGTVFTVTPAGNETVLHKVSDKQGRYFSQLTVAPKSPTGGLALYGTGLARGAYGYGTIVKVSLSGAVTVLHDFAGGNDGAFPTAGLVEVDGTFYGTTSRGGAYSSGTVFSVTPSGTENVIYAFHGGKQDGRYPYASLVNLNGTLYGTTLHGGAHSLGTVFSVTPSGTEQVLHSFQGKSGADGAFPYADLTVFNDTLYGTTAQGGVGCASVNGCGTAFSITSSGTEAVIYSFTCKRDGCFPYAPLLALNGKLYGTARGGAKGSVGVIFSVSPSGTERVLYDFVSSEVPELFAGLINIHRTLYGTTSVGGAYNDGTVYSVTL